MDVIAATIEHLRAFSLLHTLRDSRIAGRRSRLATDENRGAAARFTFSDKSNQTSFIVWAGLDDVGIAYRRRQIHIDITPAVDFVPIDGRIIARIVLARCQLFTGQLRNFAEAIPLSLLRKRILHGLRDALRGRRPWFNATPCFRRVTRALPTTIASFEDETRHASVVGWTELCRQALTTKRHLEAVFNRFHRRTISEIIGRFVLIKYLRRAHGTDDSLRTQTSNDLQGPNTRIRFRTDL